MGIQSFLWFLFVFALILLMAYYVTKYFAAFSVSTNRTKHIKVIDRYIIARDKYILLIKVGKYLYLIGVTNNDIRIISQIDYLNDSEHIEADDSSVHTNGLAVSNFREILGKYFKNKKGS
ncbi:flagellar biosynthetic protein FliO [Calorimonas adulescens]|nr:flagellar biosynthetic protein FliO [Calorimonas adulescens]